MNAYQVSDRVPPQHQFLTTMFTAEGSTLFESLPSDLHINSELDVLSHRPVFRPDVLLVQLHVWSFYDAGQTRLKIPWIQLLRERPIIGLVAVGDMEMVQVAGLQLIQEGECQFYKELKLSPVCQWPKQTGRWCVQQALTFGLLLEGSVTYKQMVGNN